MKYEWDHSYFRANADYTTYMPTIKTRINISIPYETERVLAKLARRDHMPKATKAAHLIAAALETEEDIIWDAIARKRDHGTPRFIPHKKAWA